MRICTGNPPSVRLQQEKMAGGHTTIKAKFIHREGVDPKELRLFANVIALILTKGGSDRKKGGGGRKTAEVLGQHRGRVDMP